MSTLPMELEPHLNCTWLPVLPRKVLQALSDKGEAIEVASKCSSSFATWQKANQLLFPTRLAATVSSAAGEHLLI